VIILARKRNFLMSSAFQIVSVAARF